MSNACSRCCVDFLNTCVNESPFDADDNKGRIMAVVKRLLLGLVISGAIGVSFYYLSIARPSLWFSPGTQHKMAIANAVIFGTLGLGLTAAAVCSAWKSYGSDRRSHTLYDY